VKIGIVTADDALAYFLETEIQGADHDVIRSRDLAGALKGGPALIFAEWTSEAGLEAVVEDLRLAASMTPPVPVVALVPHGAALRQRAQSLGALDALVSPPDSEEIHAEIQQATGSLAFLDPMERARFESLAQESLIGESPSFLRCLDELRLAARSEANVLLIGETGTGKEMFAQAIHKLGRRSGGPCVAVNCGAIPANLLESELFGAAKGAFTGADRDRAGRFEAAKAGTLLLDEVGDIELALQVKLLRAIEQKRFQRLGENKDREFGARLISATSVDLEQAESAGRFRPDLLGRINQFRIALPPLRERQSDIAVLARHFKLKHCGARIVEISRSAMEALQNFDFPMNVRQLENAIIGALDRSAPGDVILPRHLPKEIVSPTPRKAATCRPAITIPDGLSYQEACQSAQRELDRIYIRPLMKEFGGNQSRVAKELGIDRETLKKRLKDLDKEPE
jgi:DNA-binding NtrC family response regulator